MFMPYALSCWFTALAICSQLYPSRRKRMMSLDISRTTAFFLRAGRNCLMRSSSVCFGALLSDGIPYLQSSPDYIGVNTAELAPAYRAVGYGDRGLSPPDPKSFD